MKFPPIKFDLNFTSILLLVFIFIAAFLWVSVSNESRQLQKQIKKSYEEKLKTKQAEIDSIHKSIDAIHKKLELSENKTDSAVEASIRIDKRLAKIKKQNEELINDIKNLSANDSWDAFVKYLDKRPNQ